MDALHAQIPQLAARGRVDGGQLRGGARAGSLSLLAADARGGLWWRLVLGLVLLIAFLVVLVAAGRLIAS